MRWNRSIFRSGRRRRLGQPVGDAVVAADLVEQHLPALAEPVGELLAIVGEHLLRHPEPEPAPAANARHTARPVARSTTRADHAEPGMVIDPGHDLGLPHHPGGRRRPARPRRRCRAATAASAPAAPTADTSPAAVSVSAAAPGPCRIRIRLIVAVAGTVSPAGGCLQQLHPDPLRTPPRMLPPHLRHRDPHRLRRGMRTRLRPMGPVRQPGRHPPGRYRASQACSDCRDTPTAAATSVTCAPPSTARTASNRCSTIDNTTRAIPALPRRRHHDTAPQDGPDTTRRCQASADTRLSTITRDRTSRLVSTVDSGSDQSRRRDAPRGRSACPRFTAGRLRQAFRTAVDQVISSAVDTRLGIASGN